LNGLYVFMIGIHYNTIYNLENKIINVPNEKCITCMYIPWNIIIKNSNEDSYNLNL